MSTDTVGTVVKLLLQAVDAALAYLDRLLVWLFAVEQFWFATMGLALAITLGHAFGEPGEQQIRIAGLLLEVCGLSTVALGIRGQTRLFRRPDMLESLHNWIAAFPRAGRVFNLQAIEGLSINARLGLTGASLGHVLSSPQTVEQRLAALEQAIKEANSEIGIIRQSVKEESAKQAAALEEERGERIEGDARVSTQLEEAAAGGLALEALGLSWLLLGLIGSTIPDVIIDLWEHAF